MFDGMHDGWMWGMHWLWWLFWLVVIVAIAWAAARWSRVSGPPDSAAPPEAPLETLQRRYANGEISTEEYEERKTRLEG